MSKTLILYYSVTGTTKGVAQKLAQDLGADLTAAGFTLAERITGVSCTQELFERAGFTVAIAALPG